MLPTPFTNQKSAHTDRPHTLDGRAGEILQSGHNVRQTERDRDDFVATSAARPLPHREAETPTSLVMTFPADRPLRLDSGAAVAPLSVAYQTYGTLNAAKSNAVLVCHALTGDQHVANVNPVTGKPGKMW